MQKTIYIIKKITQDYVSRYRISSLLELNSYFMFCKLNYYYLSKVLSNLQNVCLFILETHCKINYFEL